ncbi:MULTISPECIES: DUF3617 family protein [unclassified Hyphomonas]|jgi:hypothetical protein|uniref:DUF3617 family protein n=1 Tax=unclassified Hyphomonas TaxID=2630699 RepID=UPI000458F497|nr:MULTISPECIES: DUF3617 family protein [unclassified Hyphomonas]KCZ48131.1 hypothetical protein HY17_17730 [Hyphomonas sp. CY54-11-8]RAN39893.1 hypothetical protein HY26_14660 [Hyphomonas sp. GM-8P]
MTRSGLLLSLLFAFASPLVVAAEGISALDPGLYAVNTEIETSLQDPGTGTLLDTWTEPFGGAACLEGEEARRIRPDTFIDERCYVSNVHADPYGEAFDVACTFPEGLLTGTGILQVDPTRPTEFLQRFTLRSPGPVASQRVTIKGRLVGACLPDDLAAGP